MRSASLADKVPLSRALDELRIDFKRVHMTNGADAACKFDGRMTRAATEIRQDLPLADVSRPIEGLSRGTPLEHRHLAPHALGVDIGSNAQGTGQTSTRDILHLEAMWSPNRERRAACASSPGPETQQK